MPTTQLDPLYKRVCTELTKQLAAGRSPAGSRFMTERELATQFQVSRTTANKILSSLVADEWLEFRKGIGTFVRPPRIGFELRSLVSFTAQTQRLGLLPKTVLLAHHIVEPAQVPPSVRSHFRATLGPPTRRPARSHTEQNNFAHFIERLRLTGETPLILERRWVNGRLCPNLPTEALTASLYAYWSQTCGLVLGAANEWVRAEVLSNEDANLLQLTAPAAAIVIERHGWLATGEMLWWEETRYRADRYEFFNQIGHPQSPPAERRLKAKDAPAFTRYSHAAAKTPGSCKVALNPDERQQPVKSQARTPSRKSRAKGN